jgi:threonine/homoserine/homoserine lactone efflux protein
MEIGLYFSFCFASFLLAIMPGPDNLFVITESIVKGAKSAIFIAIGLNSGVLVHTLAAATGLSLILQRSELAFTIVQFGGVLYLIYLAYKTYREPDNQDINFDEQDVTAVGKQNLWKTGFIMNLLNPKVSLFFIAFLPQFVQKGGIDPIYQMIIFGLSFMLIGLITFISFALLAERLRKPLSKSAFWKWVKWLKFSVLLILAIFLTIN